MASCAGTVAGLKGRNAQALSRRLVGIVLVPYSLRCTEVCPKKPMPHQPEDVFAILVKKLKCIKVYDHVPKPCRDTVANILSSLLNELCEDPYNLDHWIRLACFFRLFS